MKFSVPGLAGASRLICALLLCALAGAAQAHDAAALRLRHAELREALSNNQFQRPLYLQSSEDSGDLKGDIYAEVGQPYAVVGTALQGAAHWCDILILHLNVKACRASGPKVNEGLSLYVGTKYYQALADAYLFEFRYQLVASTPDYLQVVMNAKDGPLGTKAYRITLEVAALDAHSSFLHLSYSYRYGLAARIATQGYLATKGRDKLGFSIVGRKADGQPEYQDGMRGVVERNTMRYYLAIDAYLAALLLPPPQQLDKRLNDWQSGVERYPLQLHELERADYLQMKHKEVQRQQALRTGAAAQ